MEDALVDNDDEVKKGSRWKRIRDALFVVAREVCMDMSVYKMWVILLWAFDMLQLLSMPLSPSRSFPWRGSSVMTGFQMFLVAVSFLPNQGDAPTYRADVLYFIAAGVVILLVVLFSWGICIGAGLINYAPQWRAKFFRFLLRICSLGIIVPLCAALASPFSCPSNSYWASPAYPCWGGDHIAVAIGSLLLLPFFVLLVLVFTLLGVDRTPDPTGKKNLLSSPNGRVHALANMVKIALATYFAVSQDTSAWARTAVYGIGALSLLFLTIYSLPYHTQWLNQLQAGLASMFVCASISLALALGMGEATANTGAVVFFFLLPLAFYSGMSLATFRFSSVKYMSDLNSPFFVELKARFLLAGDIEEASAAQLGGTFGTRLNGLDQARRGAGAVDRITAGGVDLGLTSGMGGEHMALGMGEAGNARRESQNNPRRDSQGNARRDSNVNSRRDSRNDGAGSMKTNAYTVAAKNMNDDYTSRVEDLLSNGMARAGKLYTEAAEAFPTSAMMHLHIAQFIGIVRKNTHLERIHLRLAEMYVDQSAIDIQFFCWQRNAAIAEDETTRSTKMTVEKRMAYERLLATARIQVMAARNLVFSFWNTLSEKSPDLTRMQNIGLTINAALAAADTTFKELMTLAPQSTTVMRTYAEFLLELANDPKAGLGYLQDAEGLEDEQSRALANQSDQDVFFGKSIDFDLSTTDLGLVRVSAHSESLGAITGANAAALKMFGYNRRELMGRDIALVVPEPISSIHHIYVNKYQETGQERITNRSIFAFGAHRSGYLFPMRMNARSNGDDFQCVVDEVITSTFFAFFTGSETGWCLHAVCKSIAALLNVDLGAMKAGQLSAAHFIADIQNSVTELTEGRDEGAILRLYPFLNDRTSALLQNANTTTTDDDAMARRQDSVITVVARLQALRLAHLNSVLYIMRFKRATKKEARRRFGAEMAAKKTVRVNKDPEVDDNERRKTKGKGKGKPSPVFAHHSESEESEQDSTSDRSSIASDEAQRSDDDHSGIDGGADNRSDFSHGKLSPRAPRVNLSTTKAPPLAFQQGSLTKSGSEDPGPDSNSRQLTRESVPPPTKPAGFSKDPLASGGSVEHAGSAIKYPSRLPGNVMANASVVSGGSAEHFSAAMRSGLGNLSISRKSKGSNAQRARREFSSKRSGVLKHSKSDKNDGEKSSLASSRHSANTGTSATSVTEILRRGVMARGNQLEKSLVTLRRAILATFVATAIMNVAALFVTKALFDQLTANIELVSMNGMRGVYLQRIYAAAQRLLLAADGKYVIADGGNITRARMLEDLQSMDTLHQTLFLAVDGQLEAEVVLYTTPSVAIHDLVLNTYVNRDIYNVTTRMVGLANIGLETLAKGRRIALEGGGIANAMQWAGGDTHSPLANGYAEKYGSSFNMSMSNPTVFYFLVNGFAGIRDGFNRSMMIANDRSASQANQISLVDLIIVLIACAMFLFIVACVMTPAVLKVIRAKQSIFDTFLEVPVEIIRALRARTLKKIEAVRQAQEDAAIGIDIAGRGDEFDNDGMTLGNGSTIIPGMAGSNMLKNVNGNGSVISHQDDLFASKRPPPLRLEMTDNNVKPIEPEGNNRFGANKVVPYEGTGGNGHAAGEGANAPNANGDADSSANGSESLSRAMNRASEADARLAARNSRHNEDDDKADIDCGDKVVHCWASFMHKLGFGASAATLLSRKNRRYKRAASVRVKMTLAMIWPVIMYVGYFIGTYFWKESLVQFSRSAKSEVLWSKQAQFFISQLNFCVRNAYAYCEPGVVREGIDCVRNNALLVEAVQDALLYGDDSRELRAGLQVSDNTFKLFMRDGCIENGGYWYDMESCRTAFFSGLVGRGLTSAFKEYIQILRRMVDRREAEVAGNNCTISDMNGGDALLVQSFAETYLAAGFDRASSIRKADALDTINNFISLFIIITCFSTAALEVFWIFIYAPMLRRLDKEIKHVRLLMLLFPDEVSRRVPAIIAASRELLKDSASVGLSVSIVNLH
jgi:PAS domain-containing protein